MAQIPIMDKDFFLILVTGVCYLEFDFQSPLAPSGPRGQKTCSQLRVPKFGIGLAKNTPANQRFNIQMQIKGSQISFIPNNIRKCNLYKIKFRREYVIRLNRLPNTFF